MGIEETPVSQLMTRGVETTTPETSVRDAAEQLVDADVGSLVVLEENTDELAGVVTNSDLVEIISNGEAGEEIAVQRYMTEPPVTIGPEQTLQDASAKMMANDVHHLPVYEDNSVVGMLSTTDLTSFLSFLEERQDG